jgi:hypothetical protein
MFLWKAITVVTRKIFHSFSVAILLRTLFDPWKKDVLSAENASLQARFQIVIANLVSRLIGVVVRLMTILVGLLMTIVSFLIMFIGLIIWIFAPVICLYLIIRGTLTIING